MTDPAVHASRNAFPSRLSAGRTVALPVAAAIFLTLTEAFGLEILPLGERFLYWVVLLGTGQMCGLLIRASVDRLQLSPPKLVLAGLGRIVLLSLPLTVAVWLVTSLVLSQPLHAVRLPQFFLPVAVVVAAMSAINLLLPRRPFETHAAGDGATPRDAAGPAPIVARFPPKLRGGRLYAVQAEDHYIRLYTSAGSDLVLLRFSDALGELRGIEGAQVHRSWWIARDAVATSRREDGKIFLLLHDGTKAPVSRTFAGALHAEGWW